MTIRSAKIHEVHKNSFFGPFTKNLWRSHNRSPSISSKFRIMLAKYIKHPAQKLQNIKIKYQPLKQKFHNSINNQTSQTTLKKEQQETGIHTK